MAPGAARPSSAWTAGGAPLPFAVPARDPDVRAGAPLELADVYLDALGRDAARRAAIPVERIAGSLLLISGTDDRVWPARQMADAIMTRLSRAGHPFAREHLSYWGAGHAVGCGPGLPAAPTVTTAPGTSVRFRLGGTRATNARSGAAMWPRMIAFLERSLEGR